MKIKHQLICIILFSGIIFAKGLPRDWATYWQESGQAIISNQTNQWILGTAALAALAATQVDMQVTHYAQTKGLMSDPVSHFGDKYGAEWSHWILWSSILVTSNLNDDSIDDIISKIQFSSFALMTNRIITVGLKRIVGRVRPNGNCCKSFPSGHTSHSFTIAAIARELYGDEIGALAYSIATLVAFSRINDNKHYLSDVIFGAALGTAVGTGFALNYSKYASEASDSGITPHFQLKFTILL